MKLTKLENKIIEELFRSSNGLFIFTLYRQLNLTPKDLFTAIENLKFNGLINEDGDRVTLTSDGSSFAVKGRLRDKISTNKHLAKEFQGQKIDINEFYIPQNFMK